MTLLLISLNLRKVFLTVTGFTIGHSITLALAALELIQPSTVAIEALIGFTILLVASQALLLEDKKNSVFLKSSVCFLIILGLSSLIFGGIVSPLTWIGLIIFTVSYAYLVETKKDAESYNPALTLVFGLIHGFGKYTTHTDGQVIEGYFEIGKLIYEVENRTKNDSGDVKNEAASQIDNEALLSKMSLEPAPVPDGLDNMESRSRFYRRGH